MIPLVIRLKIQTENKKAWRLWIPLPLLYFPAAIFVFFLSPILLAALMVLAIVKGVWIVRALPAIFIFISSLGGLHIDINSKDSEVYFSIQ